MCKAEYNDRLHPGSAMMPSDDPITFWIDGIKAGDAQAAAKLWERYSIQLLNFARRRLTPSRARANDEEDVVLSAFNSLFRRARKGAFSRLNDRNDLWRLLVTITHRKALRALRRECTAKRGGGGNQSYHDDPWDSQLSLPGQEPTPEVVASMKESLAALLSSLDDDELRKIALLKMEQYTDSEVAAITGRSRATIERR